MLKKSFIQVGGWIDLNNKRQVSKKYLLIKCFNYILIAFTIIYSFLRHFKHLITLKLTDFANQA